MNNDRPAVSLQIAAVLHRHHVMSLATVCPDGPHAANLFYAREGFTLLWVSESSNRHSVAVETDARLPRLLQCDCKSRVECSVSSINRHGSACGCLEARYSFLHAATNAPKELKAAYERAQFYRLEPSRIVIIQADARIRIERV